MSTLRTRLALREAIKMMLSESPISMGYEKSILRAIKSAGAQGNITRVTGDDATLPDADIKIDDVIYAVEVKLNDRAQMGGGSVGWDTSGGFFPTGKPHAQEEVKPIVDILNDDSGDLVAAIEAFIEFLNKKGKKVAKLVTGFPMHGFLVTAWDEATAKGLLKPLNRMIENDVSFVFRHYAKKNVSYIQIGGRGLFYLADNPANLPVPQLSGRTILEFRAARSGSHGTPTGASGQFRVQARLKPEGHSPYTLDDPESVRQLLAKVEPRKMKFVKQKRPFVPKR